MNLNAPLREQAVLDGYIKQLEKVHFADLPLCVEDARIFYRYVVKHLNVAPKNITIMSSEEDYERIVNQFGWDEDSEQFK